MLQVVNIDAAAVVAAGYGFSIPPSTFDQDTGIIGPPGWVDITPWVKADAPLYAGSWPAFAAQMSLLTLGGTFAIRWTGAQEEFATPGISVPVTGDAGGQAYALQAPGYTENPGSAGTVQPNQIAALEAIAGGTLSGHRRYPLRSWGTQPTQTSAGGFGGFPVTAADTDGPGEPNANTVGFIKFNVEIMARGKSTGSMFYARMVSCWRRQTVGGPLERIAADGDGIVDIDGEDYTDVQHVRPVTFGDFRAYTQYSNPDKSVTVFIGCAAIAPTEEIEYEVFGWVNTFVGTVGAPLGVTDPIINGGFENQPQDGWTLMTLASVIGPDPLSAHSGDRYARLAGDVDEFCALGQVITVPVGATLLSFWYRTNLAPGAEPSVGFYQAPPAVGVIGAVTLDPAPDWTLAELDLSSFIGPPLLFAFNLLNQSGPSTFDIDDVAIT